MNEITRWTGTIYGEMSKGCFETLLFREESYGDFVSIAYTDGDRVRIYNDTYEPRDREAVEEFADMYGSIEWK